MKRKTLLSAAILALALPVALSQRFTANNAQYIGDYTEKKSYIEHGVKVNEQICDEGMILLKNDGFLPFKNVKKISIVGKNAFNFNTGAGGRASSGPLDVSPINLEDAFKDAGFEVNQTVMDFYGRRGNTYAWNNNNASGPGRSNGNDSWKGNSQVQIGETPISLYSQEVLNSFDQYKDVAIQFITREGSEGCDMKAIDARDYDPASNLTLPSGVQMDEMTDKHALQMSDNERELFNKLKKHFQHVVIVLNTPVSFECDSLQKDSKVSGIIWMGLPGDTGITSLVNILTGKVNPSGRTVDTWARDFKQDPTYQNFSDNSHNNNSIVNKMDLTYSNKVTKQVYAPQDTMFNADGTPVMSFGSDKTYINHADPRWESEMAKVVKGGMNGVRPSAYVTFEEDIYRDYRYYETKYADLAASNKSAANEWYDSNKGVVYPFGYGLSYTKFETKLIYSNYNKKTKFTADSKNVEIVVNVKNTGDVMGKEVVQAYFKAPYIKGEIEKPYEVLCAFAKTKLLKPGESQDVGLTFNLQDVASYDYQDKNHNGFKGYELDAGTYHISINKNAHEVIADFEVKLDEGIKYEKDRYTGNKVENRFSNNDFDSSLPLANDVGYTLMSRANMDETFPKHPTTADRTLKNGSKVEEYLTREFTLADLEISKNGYYLPNEAIVTKEQATAAGWSQVKSSYETVPQIKIDEMRGVSLDDPKWDTFINQLSFSDLTRSSYSFRMSGSSVTGINKNAINFNYGSSCARYVFFAHNALVAATWNVDLAEEEGASFGTACNIAGMTGWAGPNASVRRSPFGGKNFETYSADPLINGKMCARFTKAAQEKGVIIYVKSFGYNNQEKNREGGIAYESEQALREIDLKPFQMVVEEGQARGIQTAYNRIGLREVQSSYQLLTKVLRQEWGFQGNVLTDMHHVGNASCNFKCYECPDYNIMAGSSSILDSTGYTSPECAKWDVDAGVITFEHEGKNYESYTLWGAIRRAAKEELYVYANSFMTNKGLIQSTDNIEVEGETALRVGEDANITIRNKNNAFTLSIDKETPLPEGLKFENGVITGQPVKEGHYTVNFLLKSGEEAKYGKEIKLDILPAQEGAKQETKKKGCFGELNASIMATGLVGLSIIALIIAKKRKERLA